MRNDFGVKPRPKKFNKGGRVGKQLGGAGVGAQGLVQPGIAQPGLAQQPVRPLGYKKGGSTK